MVTMQVVLVDLPKHCRRLADCLFLHPQETRNCNCNLVGEHQLGSRQHDTQIDCIQDHKSGNSFLRSRVSRMKSSFTTQNPNVYQITTNDFHIDEAIVQSLPESLQAGHWSVQPVCETGGELLSPAMTVSTLNKSSGSPPPLARASPMKAEVIS